MKASDFILAIERFFLDIIGNLLPGCAFILGLTYSLDLSWLGGEYAENSFGFELRWFLLLAGGYIAGHLVNSVGLRVVLPIAEWIASLFCKEPKNVKSEKKTCKDIATSAVFRSFVKQVRSQYPWTAQIPIDADNLRSWRSVAMSISQENEQIIWRFMYISILNLGVATVAILTSLTSIFVVAFQRLSWIELRHLPSLTVVGALLIAVFFFVGRRYEFYARALRVPFPMALVKLREQENIRPQHQHPAQYVSPKVYLAGGFRSGWQDRVVEAVPGLSFTDPRTHGLAEPDQYTFADLVAIECCDWVFAYLEAKNPGGYSLALEVGYARALGKFIVLVDEQTSPEDPASQYLEMLRASADVTLAALPEGIKYLKSLQGLVTRPSQGVTVEPPA